VKVKQTGFEGKNESLPKVKPTFKDIRPKSTQARAAMEMRMPKGDPHFFNELADGAALFLVESAKLLQQVGIEFNLQGGLRCRP